MIRSTFAALLLVVSPVLSAELALYDGNWTEVVRATGQPVYPLTVDGTGNIYFSTGTSPFDQIRRVNTDGSVDTIHSANASVIGTVGDLEFGFDGDLFVNQSFPFGIRRFGTTSSPNSTFWLIPTSNGVGGAAFDASSNLLFVAGVEKIYALNSAGTAAFTINSRLGAGPDLGLALEPTGTLLSLHGDGIVSRIDPLSLTYNSFLDLTSTIPNWRQFKSLDVNPDTGKVIFSVELNASPTLRQLWTMDPDGTDLSLIAEGIQANSIDGPLNVEWGRSGDGTGRWSIYLGLNESQKIIELRPVAIPEASSFILIGTAFMTAALMRNRQKR